MENNENQDYIIIKSYAKVWKFDNRIYAIYNLVLPFPVSPIELLYFAVSALLMAVIGAIFPLFTLIPAIIRLVVIPIFLTRIVSKVKLDGMNPLKYFASVIGYFCTKNLFIENFQYHDPKKDAKIKF